MSIESSRVERDPQDIQNRAEYPVAIFGASGEKSPNEKDAVKLAGQLGDMLVREGGHPVLTGGYGVGVMESASRAAMEASNAIDRPDLMPRAITLGPVLGKETESAVVHRKENLTERLGTLIEESEAIVVLHGGIGTVVELATSLLSKAMSEAKRAKENLPVKEKPIVICDSSLRHTDLLSFLGKQDPKLSRFLGNVFIISGQDENGAVDVSRVIEDYYQRSTGQDLSDDENRWLEERSVRRFMEDKESFKEGGGI